MSDPLAQDVEDVLTSIRRLVSDTDSDADRGQAAAVSEAKGEAPNTDLRDALILTSALRVGGPEMGADDEEDTASTDEDLSEGDVEDQVGLAHGDDRDVAGEQTAEPDSAEKPSDLGSLRQAVNGAFMGEPVMPALLHSTKSAKKADDVSSALETSKGWGQRPSEDYYEDEIPAESDLTRWRNTSEGPRPEFDATDGSVPQTDEDVDRHDSETFGTDDGQHVHTEEDAPAESSVLREDASEYGEGWTDEVEPDTADTSLLEQEFGEDGDAPEKEAARPELEPGVAEDDASVDSDENSDPESSMSDDAEPLAGSASDTTGDISDDYEWDEDIEEPEVDGTVATFRHVPVDVAQLREIAPTVEGGNEAVSEGADLQPNAALPIESDGAGTGADDEADAQEDESAGVDLGDLDEAVLDEEMLRELVSDIVRKELSGDLGERITRNVRKLVRREIHRALLARELD